MAAIVTVHQAKTHLSKILARVEAGEEIIISRGKTPVARLMPLEPASRQRRTPGRFAGVLPTLPDSFFFDPLLEDDLKLWDGEGEP